VGYDYVCPLPELSPAAAAFSGVTPDQTSPTQASSARAPPAAQNLIIVPRMRVRRTPGPPRRGWTPPGPSRLRETVQAQDDERLSTVYENFERFRMTGKQPSTPTAAGGPQVVQYCPLGSSTYRPFSMPLNMTDPVHRDERQDSSVEPQASTSRRLGSTDLFPDRYRHEAPSGEASTKARNSIAEDRRPAACESAPPDDATVAPGRQPESRRSAAKSDGSDHSSNSSTESSRARTSLAYSLDKDKAVWSPNTTKSAASVSFAGFKNAVRSIANSFLPSSSKSGAEQVTRELSQSPIARSPRASGDRASRDDGPKTNQAYENARPVSSSYRSSRKNNVAALPLELDTSVEGLGMLPLPSPPAPSSPISEGATNDGHVASDSASQKQGPTKSELHVLVF